MAIKKFKVGVIIAFIGLFTGCAKEPPKCSDDATFSIVRNLFLKQIRTQEVTEKEIQENLKFEFPRATAFDEKIKKYSCVANLNIGGTYQLPITYESQLDDNNEHIASLSDISMSDLLLSKMSFIAGVKKSSAAQEKIAPAPQESANVTTSGPKQAVSVAISEPQQNVIAPENLPFIGERSFNFAGGTGTGQSISIEKDGTTTIQFYGTSDTEVLYKGKFSNPITLKDGTGLKLDGNKIYPLTNGKIDNDCMGDGKPCESELYSK